MVPQAADGSGGAQATLSPNLQLHACHTLPLLYTPIRPGCWTLSTFMANQQQDTSLAILLCRVALSQILLAQVP